MSAVLPTGWVVTSLRELVSLKTGPFGSSLHGSDYVADGIPIINPMHMEGGRISASNKHRVSVETADRLHDFKVQLNDIVIGRRGEMGRCAVVRQRETGWLCGTGSLIVRSTIGLDADFLQRYLSSDAVVKYLLQASVGSTMANLNQEVLMAITVSLPPRTEQTRIVDKLEELLSDLDAGVAELKAAQKKLTRYRQSLLKAAVEGRLTEAWRAQRGAEADSEESGAQLLARILRERRARWEAKQLAKFEAQGKAPSKGWQDKYPGPLSSSLSAIPDLPQGWTRATLDQLTEFITSGSRGWADYYAEQGSTFIRSQNINRDWLDLSDIAYVNPPQNSEGARTKVKRDDLLLTITGANVGKAASVTIDLDDAYVSQHVALIRPIEPKLTSFLHLFLTSVAGGRGQLNKEAYGAGKPGLNLQQVAAVPVPLPGAPELIAIMEEVDRQFVAASRQEKALATALRQSAAQRKNILQSAFSGQLVPQDPNDEPASVLLARIRAKRAAQSEASGSSRRPRRVASE